MRRFNRRYGYAARSLAGPASVCLLVILAFTLILVLRHWRAMLLIATVIVAVAILLKKYAPHPK